jgi:hypothetical protein
VTALATDHDETALPVDEAQTMSTQSRHALMIAHELGLLVYRMPVDFRTPQLVDQVRAELGPNAVLPTEGVYYLTYIPTADHGETFPMLIPEGEARAVALLLARLRGGPDMAAKLAYRIGVLPRG